MNALKGGHAEFAHVSFDASWSDPEKRAEISNATTGFSGTFVRNTATLKWSASEAEFDFASDPLESDFAEIGRERNGVFFSTEASDDDNGGGDH